MRIEEIARIVGGTAEGDGSWEIQDVAGLDDASGHHLSFVEGQRALERARASAAGCLLLPPGMILSGRRSIAVGHPKLAFIRAAQALRPVPPPPAGIHPSAFVAPDAQFGEGVSVGPNAVIEAGVRVGEGTSLAAGVFVGSGSEIGTHCVLYPGVTVYPGARVGNRVVLHAGVVAGGDGFGYVFAEGRHQKFPQIGTLVIEDDVEVGSNSTIDRGSLGVTRIGAGTKIDNLVQIAHNVRIGRHCVIAAQTGISGSTIIGDYVVMGGQVGIADHAQIEDNVVIGAQAGILTGKVVRKGSVVWGTPARSLAEFKRLYAHWAALPSLAAQVKELARHIGGKR
jgi:UDP-3-O-[3-hydroxymyristoyl] glucosamine N-acyltransferase